MIIRADDFKEKYNVGISEIQLCLKEYESAKSTNSANAIISAGKRLLFTVGRFRNKISKSGYYCQWKTTTNTVMIYPSPVPPYTNVFGNDPRFVITVSNFSECVKYEREEISMVIVPPYTARWNAYIDYYDVPLFKSLDDVYNKRPRQTVQNFYNQCNAFFDSQSCEKHGIVRRATNSIVYGAILKTRHSNRSVLVIYTSTVVYIIPRDLEHADEIRHSLEKERVNNECVDSRR